MVLKYKVIMVMIDTSDNSEIKNEYEIDEYHYDAIEDMLEHWKTA
jgi:hypothetical protein